MFEWVAENGFAARLIVFDIQTYKHCLSLPSECREQTINQSSYLNEFNIFYHDVDDDDDDAPIRGAPGMHE